MDIFNNVDANAWQYFFAFMEHNKLFTLVLVIITAIFWLIIKKIVKIPCNIFTGRIDNTKMMLADWEKDILTFSGNKYHFADDHAKNILFNRLAEKILNTYYTWKKQELELLKHKKALKETITSAEYQKSKLEECRQKWQAEFTGWCKLQGIARDKIRHIIRAYNKIAAGDIKALGLMISRFNGNYDYINLCFYAVLNAVEFDLEQASISFNGDLAGIKIDGFTIKGGHNGIEKN